MAVEGAGKGGDGFHEEEEEAVDEGEAEACSLDGHGAWWLEYGGAS